MTPGVLINNTCFVAPEIIKFCSEITEPEIVFIVKEDNKTILRNKINSFLVQDLETST